MNRFSTKIVLNYGSPKIQMRRRKSSDPFLHSIQTQCRLHEFIIKTHLKENKWFYSCLEHVVMALVGKKELQQRKTEKEKKRHLK